MNDLTDSQASPGPEQGSNVDVRYEVDNGLAWITIDRPDRLNAFRAQTAKLNAALAHGGGSAEKHAKYMRDTVVPAMAKLRELGDQIELYVPHAIWTLPTYREMLFVK